MTKDYAIELLKHCMAESRCVDYAYGNCARCNQRIALDMAIQALKDTQENEMTFEWCQDCKEYDKENNCCHRYAKIISTSLDEIKAYSIPVDWIENWIENHFWWKEADLMIKDWYAELDGKEE